MRCAHHHSHTMFTSVDIGTLDLVSHVNLKLRVLAVVVSATAGLVYAGAAAASCQPPRTPNYEQYGISVGWYASPPSGTCVDGSRADIQVKAPYVYAEETRVFTDIFNSTNATYAEVGWQQEPSTRYDYTETNVVSTGYFAHDTYGTPSTGTNPEYKVTFSSGALHYFIAGTNVLTASNTGFNGCYSHQVGDTFNDANQMAGEPSNHEEITSSNLRRHDTESWYTATNWFPFTGYPAWYNKQVQSNTAIDIWDTCQG